MKRSGSWSRKKPLKQTGALRRQSEISRRAMNSKPPKRTTEETKARALLRARSNSICELCGREPATDAHHRLNRSQGGLWAIENLLHLCHREHMQITVNPALAVERGWSVRSTSNPAATPVWLAGQGWSLLAADGSVATTERRVA